MAKTDPTDTELQADTKVLTPAEVRQLFEPDWARKCTSCGEQPIVPMSQLCGPCHFGQAAAVAGGWWDPRAGTLSGGVEW